MIFIPIYLLFVVWLAKKDSVNIKQGKKIRHWINGLIHVAVSFLIGWGYGWHLAASNLLLTRVVFDTALNIFRHYSLGYVPSLPASKIDKVEKWIVFKIAGLLYRKRTIIPENLIERVAIFVRLIILKTGIVLLFI